MRAAAGAPGLRETFRRALHRLRAHPVRARGGALMEGLDSGPRLVAAGRAAADRFADVELKPRRPRRHGDRLGGGGVGRATVPARPAAPARACGAARPRTRCWWRSTLGAGAARSLGA